ncbi:MAG: GTP diphosphokinase [Pseudomonadota bacterium]
MVFVESISEDHVTPGTRFLALLSQLQSAHYTDEDVSKLREAFEFTQLAHHGQTRASGEPYVFHVISVAEILISLKLDIESIIAALLHDVVEDTDITHAQLEEKFGEEIAGLVNGVTKMRQVSHLTSTDKESHSSESENSTEIGNSNSLKAENLRKLLLAMAKDVRVVMIKLADRLHNMRTLSYLPKIKQQLIARETSEIYAPLANRLGIWQLKWELEDLSFRYLDGKQYKQIASHLKQRKVDRDDYITDVISLLELQLKNVGIKGDVSGRSKHIYSIWKKMHRKKLGFHQLYDLSAVRILVHNIKDCYHVLGIVHTLWKHIAMEFDDYIATPKKNNYQSIHTAVIGPEDKTLEIQIRTYDMHKHAEYGVAAHWRYKEGGKQSENYEQKIAWLRQLLDWKDEEQNAGDFIDRFKSEVFQDRVYVLTPAGELVDLPLGATPLDFAFYVHTEIGARCRGAKVNGKMVSLTYELKNGEQIQILTRKNASPSRDWLNPHLGYLKTPRARSKVKSWFKHQDHDYNVIIGREILEKELHRLAVASFSYDKLVEKFSLQSSEDLFVNIGRGEITSSQIAHAIQFFTEKNKSESLKKGLVEPVQQMMDLSLEPHKDSSKLKTNSSDISIEGIDNLLTQIAHCCSPVPGDDIIGFITKTRGITIHRSDCQNLNNMTDEQNQRIINVEWNIQCKSGYTVTIEVTAMDRQGLLRDITILLANININLLSVSTLSDKDDLSARLKLTIEITGIEQLSQALNKIVQIPNVIEAYRIND